MHPDTNLNKFGSATDRDRKTLQQYFFDFLLKTKVGKQMFVFVIPWQLMLFRENVTNKHM